MNLNFDLGSAFESNRWTTKIPKIVSIRFDPCNSDCTAVHSTAAVLREGEAPMLRAWQQGHLPEREGEAP